MSRVAWDPRELSNAELRRRCERCRPWELGLGAVQLAASTAAGGAVLAAAAACIPGLVQCISVGPALAAGIVVWEALGVGKAWLPGAACRDELAFRDWHAGLSPWVGPRALRRWAERAMAQERAPDWLLVLEGVAPGSGARRWAKIEIARPPSSAAPFRAQASGHALLRAGGTGGAASRERHLAPDELDDVLESLAAFPDGLSLARPSSPPPPATPRDTSPPAPRGRCDVLVARRAPFAAVQLSCELPWLEPDPREPSAALLRSLVQVAWPEDEITCRSA
ncbi:hypothetical protein SOCE26_056760 [Sorangium cellulosum]|uniref:Uncharacterized protein n=1 Tax=Sorangium cellulosum TaxID=56 RepID=A0A2L0EY35_SORCE|nr:hypothetical protein [Sorangium cellulosum]AUX44212.1 hypothetical protein SOCE26_056760 [Sorangium cellulosum]